MKKTLAEEASLHHLSLIIVGVAMVVFVLFFFAWLSEANDAGETQSVAGITIATGNVQPTRNFPSGLLFLVPFISGSMVYQYGKRLYEGVRPRRRLESALMILTTLMVVLIWVRLYAINVADNPPEPSPFDLGEQVTYTRAEVLREIVTRAFWVQTFCLVLLVALPFFDRRPEAPPPKYLEPTPPLNG